MAGLIFFIYSVMKLCNMHLQCNVPPRVQTTAVSPVVSVSVIGLIIDASIPAGAGHAARKCCWAEGESREGRGGWGWGD